MRIEEYDYILPKELIAQQPYLERDKCRLMVLNRKTKEIYHKRFIEIIDFLNEGDVIVLNNSRVIPAKLIGYKADTGGKKEILLLSKVNTNIDQNKEVWKVKINNKKDIKEGTCILFNNNSLKGKVVSKSDEDFIMEFRVNKGSFINLLEKIGLPPLPPYIKRDCNNIKLIEKDKVYYQTIYAKFNGSIAAPTAGLHFTHNLLNKIKEKGVIITEITLHIGKGTFQPIRSKDIELHKMEEEYFEISEDSANLINEAKKRGKKVIAVGTSTTRALETSFDPNVNMVKPTKKWSDLYIYEGYKFNVISGLITNFHLPKSTNLVLTCTFGGRDFVLQAYKNAVENRYNFYSYGDAMYII